MHLSAKQFIDLIPSSDIIDIKSSSNLDKIFVNSATIDSRTVENGSIFFALPGEQVDGHQFIDSAFKTGATICIGSKTFENKIPEGKVYIQSRGPLSLLQHAALAYRNTYIQETKIIGVTGSVGKTTTKDMLANAFAKLKPVVTEGNLNNHIGVPLMLLRINPEDTFAILEAGMNHRGEIAPLAQMMQPETVVITNIGTAHLEHLKTQEEIAREKMDLATKSPRIKTLIMPKTDPWTCFIKDNLKDNLPTEKQINFIESEMIERIPMNLPIPGNHMKENAWLAYHTAKLYGISDKDIFEGFSNLAITPRRLQIHECKNNITIIDDSYNANPDSMKAGLIVLSQYAENSEHHAELTKVAILGGMAELGDKSVHMHQDIIKFALSQDEIEYIFLIGEAARSFMIENSRVHFFATHDECLKYVENQNGLFKHDTVFFIKGSKSTKMTVIADYLIQRLS